MAQTQHLVLRIVAQRGEISSGDLSDVGQKFGLSADAVRSAANRMAREGLLDKVGRGRGNVQYRVGPQGQAIIDRFVAKIHRWHAALEGFLTWDGRWLVVTFSVPEEQRGKRDAFRAQLTDLGFGLLTSSVWVSPFDYAEGVVASAQALAIEDWVALLRCQRIWMPGVDDGVALVRRIWDLETLGNRYRDLNRRTEALQASLGQIKQGQAIDLEKLFFEAMNLQNELLEIIFDEDPFLPIDLLPADWPSQRTHHLIHDISRAVAKLEVAADERYHYLFHLLRDMEVLEVFLAEDEEVGFHWPDQEAGR
ncbi:MAG TPA: hypothetical protein ENN19_07185 [Chloroflexi bacterium]|nr:hypothetical protein [Chloroflexota bacterium]